MARKAKRIPKSRLTEYRDEAFRMYKDGFTPRQIATALRAGRSTVFNWLAQSRAGGLSAPVSPSGRPPKLSDSQLARLLAMLCKDPRQLEFDFGLWTRAMVAELIQRKFNVSMSVQAVGRMMRNRMGLSPQRPVVRAAERNAEAVARWREQDYPAIAARALAEGASVWFQDESGVRSDYHSGTTWAPIGCTPVVVGTGKRFSVNMISSVSPRGRLHFRLAEGRLNAEKFIDYLRALLHDVKGKIFLVVDGHPTHKAKKVKAFLETTAGRLELFFLPGYSPNLNPDEWVWKNIKHDTVGKTTVFTEHELRAVIQRAVDRLRKFPTIVRGFFRDPELAYITAAHSAVQ